MKVIREAFNTISAYWGVQNCKETKYRLIRYCVQSDYDGKTLLLNTVTGEMILLSKLKHIRTSMKSWKISFWIGLRNWLKTIRAKSFFLRTSSFLMTVMAV